MRKTKTNMEIRLAAKESGVFLWEVAEELEIQESRLCKILRAELPPEEKKKILAIIDRLSKEGR